MESLQDHGGREGLAARITWLQFPLAEGEGASIGLSW